MFHSLGYYHCDSSLVLLNSGLMIFNSSFRDEVLLNVEQKGASTLVITLIVLLILAAFAIMVTCYK